MITRTILLTSIAFSLMGSLDAKPAFMPKAQIQIQTYSWKTTLFFSIGAGLIGLGAYYWLKHKKSPERDLTQSQGAYNESMAFYVPIKAFFKQYGHVDLDAPGDKKELVVSEADRKLVCNALLDHFDREYQARNLQSISDLLMSEREKLRERYARLGSVLFAFHNKPKPDCFNAMCGLEKQFQTLSEQADLLNDLMKTLFAATVIRKN